MHFHDAHWMVLLLICLSLGARAEPPFSGEDSEIAGVMMAGDQSVMKVSEIGRTSRRVAIRTFANRIYAEALSNTEEAVRLFSRIQLVPRTTSMSVGMLEDADDYSDHFSSVPNSEFYSVFFKEEVNVHQLFMGLLHTALIPSVRNGQFRVFLTKRLTTLTEHLVQSQNFAESYP